MPKSSARVARDQAATRRWVERLERFAAGHSSVAAFCAAEGVSQSNFYMWRRRLAQHALPPRAPAPPAVVPIRVAPPPTPAAPIELSLPSGNVVRFPADVHPDMLVAVLRGLEESPC